MHCCRALNIMIAYSPKLLMHSLDLISKLMFCSGITGRLKAKQLDILLSIISHEM